VADLTIEPRDFGVQVEHLQRLQAGLKDPQSLLRQIGTLLLVQATRAFEEQGLGDIKWKPRYPNQKAPMVNIAGSLQDLNKGREPKARRFQRRPALMDSKALYQSVSKNNPAASRLLGAHVIEVGSVKEYAGLMQHGGRSTQAVTSQAKKTLAKWSKSLRGKRRRMATFDPKEKTWKPREGKAPPRKRKAKGGKAGTPTKSRKGTGGGGDRKGRIPKTSGMSGGQQKAFGKVSNEINRASKLGFLFGKSRLVTNVVPRPFLGTTTQSMRDITELTENWIVKYVSS